MTTPEQSIDCEPDELELAPTEPPPARRRRTAEEVHANNVRKVVDYECAREIDTAIRQLREAKRNRDWTAAKLTGEELVAQLGAKTGLLLLPAGPYADDEVVDG